jgi:hypothetical protein
MSWRLKVLGRNPLQQTPPERMSSHEQLVAAAALIATGLVRLRASGEREVGLELPANQRVYANSNSRTETP